MWRVCSLIGLHFYMLFRLISELQIINDAINSAVERIHIDKEGHITGREEACKQSYLHTFVHKFVVLKLLYRRL
jgi:hypothetical protein